YGAGKRQNAAFILQQHDAFGCKPGRYVESFRGHLRRSRGTRSLVEQTQAKFEPQDVADGVIDRPLLDCTRTNERFEVIEIARTDHLDVNACAERLACGIARVQRVPMFGHLRDRLVVADYNAVKFPFLAQYAPQREGAPSGWYSVQSVERRHERSDAGLEHGSERPEINLAKQDLRYPRCVVIFARFRSSVADIVFGTGRQ